MKKIITSVFLVIILTFTFCLCGCSTQRENNTTSFLQAIGKEIVDKDNHTITLRGVNAGGWLVQEGWMGFTKLNQDDSIEVSQTLVINKLTERFGEQGASELLDVYLDNYWTEMDFDNVKQLGFNTIRLPFTYLDILDKDYNVKDDAFERIDWFVNNCAKRELYVILDCHGAIGSQNGQHHSGDYSQAELYNNPTYMQKTLEMWVEIAKHYKDNTFVAGYDLLNEPQGGLREGKTTEKQWDYYDQLYKAVRLVDNNHIIFIESCWEQGDLPKPSKYGWTNVVYEYHYYNWAKPNSAFVNWLFINSKVIMGAFVNHNVPAFIGEFTFFDNAKCWNYGLNTFDKNGWSWTVWNYKVNKSNNWGLYKTDVDKVDVSTASYQQIVDAWTNIKTSGFTTSDTFTAVKTHMDKSK